MEDSTRTYLWGTFILVALATSVSLAFCTLLGPFLGIPVCDDYVDLVRRMVASITRALPW
jgi:hypothetical protein